MPAESEPKRQHWKQKPETKVNKDGKNMLIFPLHARVKEKSFPFTICGA